MVWFRVDDNLAFHPKVMEAGNAAMGLWVRAGSWSTQQLTDGYIPASVVPMLGGRSATARRLCECGLWTVAAGGYQFHEWGKRQISRADVEKSREDGAARQRRSRERRSESDSVTRDNDVTGGYLSQRPYPTLPYPTPGKNLGGVSHEPDVGARPPLYPDHCARHGDEAMPGACGDCADARRAYRPLEIVKTRCLIHWSEHTGTCPGCAADEKASNA